MLVDALNKEEALVGAFSVIVKPREASFPSLSGKAADVLLPDSDHWWLLLCWTLENIMATMYSKDPMYDP